jgi:hypothetical protein
MSRPPKQGIPDDLAELLGGLSDDSQSLSLGGEPPEEEAPSLDEGTPVFDTLPEGFSDKLPEDALSLEEEPLSGEREIAPEEPAFAEESAADEEAGAFDEFGIIEESRGNRSKLLFSEEEYFFFREGGAELSNRWIPVTERVGDLEIWGTWEISETSARRRGKHHPSG